MKTNTSPADISFEVGYKDDKTRFDLRMISVSEETELNQQFSDIADTDPEKTNKEYQLCLSALAGFSHSTEDGEKLREKFAEINLKKERVLRAAFQQFKYSLSPDVSFL